MKLQGKKIKNRVSEKSLQVPEKSLRHDIAHSLSLFYWFLDGFGLLDVKSSQRTGSSPGMNLLLCGATWHSTFFCLQFKQKTDDPITTLLKLWCPRVTFGCFESSLQMLQPTIGCPETHCVDIMIFRWLLRLPKFVPGAEHHAELLDMETLHSTARWEVLRWLVVSLFSCRWCPCTWTWRSALGRSRRYWFAKMMSAAKNFQYWAVRDWVDRKLAEACYTFSIQVILERLYKYKASTYFPISPPHCNRIIASAAWLTPFHWGGQGLWNFGTGAMLWGHRRSSDGRCKEDLETIWTKLGCGSIFCQVFVESWCSNAFVWILPFKKQRTLALPVVVWIIVSKISWLFRMFHWNSISQQSHPKLIHVGLLSLWSSCSISFMSRRTRCF